MIEPSLFMLLLGCRPKGRNTEQHDIFFGIGNTIKDLIPDIKKSWPEAKGNIHIDAWRKISFVDGYRISVASIGDGPEHTADKNEMDLFFINLGGYRENEFDEFHYKMLVVSDSLEVAKSKSKRTAFFKHNSLPPSDNTLNAISHIDDKFGVDIDDIYTIADILPATFKEKYNIKILKEEHYPDDVFHLGYLKLANL